MNKLPIEIVYHITPYLTYSDKLNLSCVCREWYNLVRKTCLYTHFTIKDMQRFDTAISVFKEHPRLCYQAKSIRLTRMNNKFQEILQLPILFLHLTHFAYQSYNRHYDNDLELNEQDMKPWRRLECYEETNKNLLFMLLLTNVEFPELRKIKIDFCMNYSHCDDLFRLMKNAPNLEHLELSFATVNLEMMEILHDNLPSLKTLILSDIKDAPSNLGLTFETQHQAGMRTDESSNRQLIDGQHPISIDPASDITHLQITDMMAVNGNHCMPLQWIVYIALKLQRGHP
ncbi:hypothetical protein EDC96DRAFT_516611 [Choanephora cucurbitarum]|nr:hypothetical protein EDC96DRAFT_516611 [Choanephora cucurbitarum]